MQSLRENDALVRGPAPRRSSQGGAAMSDARPVDCRFRLQDEGKPYPRSSCSGCGRTITTGLGKSCHRVPAVSDLQRQLSEAVERAEKADGWAKDWHGIVETICTVLELGTLDADQVAAAIRAKFEKAERERDEAVCDTRSAEAELSIVRKSRDGYVKAEQARADEQYRLAAEVARLREALEPFAKAADGYDPDEGDSCDVAWAHDFTIGSLRAARAALQGEPS